MTRLLALLVFMCSCHAQADIFVCKDDKKSLSYQDEPCLYPPIRKLKNIPDAPIPDQILARARIDRANVLSQQRAAAAELERQQQHKELIELQAVAIEKRKLELLEKEANDSRQTYFPQWWLNSSYGYPVGYNRPFKYKDDHKLDFNKSRSKKARHYQRSNNYR